MSKAKLYIVDDHDLVIDGLEKIILEMSEIELLGRASNGAEAVNKIPILDPDLVLMDLDMPVMNGLEASERLLKSNPDLKIIILTMHGEKPIVEKMMQLGVSGYLLKNADKEELKFGMLQVLRGKQYFHSQALSGFVSGKQLSTVNSDMQELSKLSDRELSVLKQIALGKTSVEIGEELHISTRTVETHRKNIHQKLDIKNVAGLVRFAIKSGLVS